MIISIIIIYIDIALARLQGVVLALTAGTRTQAMNIIIVRSHLAYVGNRVRL